MTDLPERVIASGNIRDIPRLASVTRDEGLVYGAMIWDKPEVFQDVLGELDYILPFLIGYYPSGENRSTVLTRALKSYYLNDMTAERNVLVANFTQLIGDGLFVYPIFTEGSENICGGSTTNMGVSHANELMYLLPGPRNFVGSEGLEFSENDWHMVDTMVQLWTSFATNGTPSLSGQNGTIWEPLSSSLDNYLQIGNGPVAGVEMNTWIPHR